MIAFTKKLLSNRFSPFLLFCLILILYHLILYVVGDFGDDLGVSFFVKDKSIFDYLLYDRYLGNSSRVAGDLLTAIFVQMPYPVFLMANCLVWIGLYRVVALLLEINSPTDVWLWTLLLLAYPFIDTLSAGPIATSTNYNWTLTALLFLILSDLKKVPLCKGLTLFFKAFSLFECCLFQITSVLLFVYSVVRMITSYQKESVISKQTLSFFVCSCLGLIIVLLSPSTENRVAMEAPLINPLFFQYSIIDKIILGLYRISQFLFGGFNIIYFSFCVLLILVGQTVKEKKCSLVMSFPIMFLFLAVILRYSRVLTFDTYYNISDNKSQILVSVFLLLISCIPFLTFLKYDTFANICISRKYVIVLPLMLVMGFLSQFIMGFAPSVYYSGNRTAIFFYFSMILSSLILLKYFRQNSWTYKLYLFLLLCLSFYNIIWMIRTLIRPIFVDIESILTFLNIK